MNDTLHTALLCTAVAWPLLLAAPALHTHLPGARYLAIIPAALLALWPGDIALELPWLMFGSGFALDGGLRWILALNVVTWFAAAVLMRRMQPDAPDARMTTCFMLTLAGSLGAVLVTELVGFFAFSTLVGYGFYGMLVQDAEVGLRRAAGRYVKYLVVADLALFEALLLAAFMTQDMRFAAVRQAMASSDSAGFYIWMVFGAFMLRAGVWPLHRWLSAVAGSASPSRLLALLAGPIVVALLGAARWLPLGETGVPGPWLVLQLGGLAAALYGLLRLVLVSAPGRAPAWLTLVFTGALFAAFATGLLHAQLWRTWAPLLYPAIAMSITVLAVVVLFGALRSRPSYSK